MAKPIERERVEPGIWKRRDREGREVFEITWRDTEQKQRRRRVQGGITAARKALTSEVSKRDRGERVAADPRLKLDTAADAWWSGRVSRLRTNTQDAYGCSLIHVRKALGRYRLQDITHSVIAGYVRDRQKAGAKGWTIKSEMTVLRGIYAHAARHMGFSGQNPVHLLDSVERPNTNDEKPKRILTDPELDRLLRAVPERHRLLFETAADTGGRLGEVLGLTWGNVDLDAEAVTFTHQLDRRGKRELLKTKRSRRVLEITPDLVSQLKAHKLASSFSGDHDLVFLSQEGTPHDHRNIAGRVLKRAVHRAELGAVERDGQTVATAPTFHSLRHTHATALIAQGWDVEQVSARLGHADVGTTMRAYVHAYDAARRSPERREKLTALRAGRGSVLAAPDGTVRVQTPSGETSGVTEVHELRTIGAERS